MSKYQSAPRTKSTIALLVLPPILLLGVLYIYTLAAFLAAAPSEGFSRDVKVATLETGFISNIQSPVTTLVNRDQTLTIIAMDGHATSIVTTDSKGRVLDRFRLNLDIYKASQLAAYHKDEDTLILFYLSDGLNMAVIDMGSRSQTSTKLESEVLSFVSQDNLLVLEKSDGLYGLEVGRINTARPLVAGVILDYAARFKDSRFYILAEVQKENSMDIRVVSFDPDLSEIKDIVVLADTRDNYLKTIQDVYVQDDILTGLYVWTDNKYGLNHLTLQQIRLSDGLITGSFSHSFPIHKGRFVIDEVEAEAVKVLMQHHIHRGVNLVMATLRPDSEPDLIPLTKTRELSQLSFYTHLGSEKVLVFWDTIRATRVVKFASTDPDLVKKTTSFLTINYLSLMGITLFVILASAFIGTVPYLMSSSLVPLVVMLGLHRFTPEYHNKAGVQNAIAGLVGTVLKLYLTWHLIHELGRFDFRPFLIGGEPTIYVALAFSSVVSWLISFFYIRTNRKYGQPYLGSFAIYLFADYAQYIMMVLVYVGSAMILDKI